MWQTVVTVGAIATAAVYLYSQDRLSEKRTALRILDAKEAMMTSAEDTQAKLDALADAVDSVTAQNNKAHAEVVAAVEALNAEIAAGNPQPNLDRLNASVAGLQAASQALDDLNPDPAAPPAA